MKSNKRKSNWLKGFLFCLAFLSCILTGGMFSVIENSLKAANSDDYSGTINLATGKPAKSGATIHVSVLTDEDSFVDSNGNTLFFHSSFGVLYTDGAKYYTNFVDGQYRNEVAVDETEVSELSSNKLNASTSLSTVVGQINNGEAFMIADLEHDGSLSNNLVYKNSEAVGDLPANSKIFSDGKHYFYFTNGSTTKLMPIYNPYSNSIKHFETYAEVSDKIIDDNDESNNISVSDVRKIYLNVEFKENIDRDPKTLSSKVGIEGSFIDYNLFTTDPNSENVLTKEQIYIYNLTKVNKITTTNKLEGYKQNDKYYRVETSQEDSWYFDGTSTKKIIDDDTYIFARNDISSDFVAVEEIEESATLPAFAVIDESYTKELEKDSNWYYNSGSIQVPNWNVLSGSGTVYSYNGTRIIINPSASVPYFIDNNYNSTFDDGDIRIEANAISNYYFEEIGSTTVMVPQSDIIFPSYTDGQNYYIDRANFSVIYDSMITTTLDELKDGHVDNNFLQIENGDIINIYFNKSIFVNGYALTNNYTTKYYINESGEEIGILQNVNYSNNFEYYYEKDGTNYVAPGAYSFNYYYTSEENYFGVLDNSVFDIEFFFEDDETGKYVYVPFDDAIATRKEGYTDETALKITENTGTTPYTLNVSIGEFGSNTNKIVDPSGIDVEIYKNGILQPGVSLGGNSTNGYFLKWSTTGVENMLGTWEVYFGGTKDQGATDNGYLVDGNRYYTKISFTIFKESDYFLAKITPILSNAKSIDNTITVENYYNANYIDENLLPYVSLNTTKFRADVTFTSIDGITSNYKIRRLNESTIEVIKNDIATRISLADTLDQAKSFTFYFTELGYYHVNYFPIVKNGSNYVDLQASNLFKWNNKSTFNLTNMGYQLLYTDYENNTTSTNFFKYSNVLTLEDYFTVNFAKDGSNIISNRTAQGLETLSGEVAEITNFSNLDAIWPETTISTNQPPISFNFSGLLTTEAGTTKTKSFYYFKSNTSEDWTLVENIKATDRFMSPGKYIVCIEFNPTKAVHEATLKQYFAFEITNSQAVYSLEDEKAKVIIDGSYTNQNVDLILTVGSEFDVKPQVSVWFTDTKYQGKTEYNGYNLNVSDIETDNITKYTFKSSRKWTVQLYFGPSVWTDKSSFINWSFTIDKNPIVYTPYNKDIYNNYYALDDSVEVIGGNIADFKLKFGDYFENQVARKNSGAYVKATYTFTPIEKASTSLTNEQRKLEKGRIYLQSDYVLNFDKTTEPTQYNYNSSKTAQGLYQFTIIDQAGNESSYYIYIDKVAPVYFVADKTLATNPSEAKPYFEVVWGDYKAIATNNYQQPTKVRQDGVTEFISNNSPVKQVDGAHYLLSEIKNKNLNFFANNVEDSIYNAGSDFVKSFNDEEAMISDFKDYLYLTKTGFKALETKRNEGKFVVYATDALGNAGANEMVSFNFDLSKTTTYVKNAGTTSNAYASSVYPDLINNTASNLDYLFITAEKQGSSSAGDWKLEYVKVDFYPVDYSTNVYSATANTFYVYNINSSIDLLSTLGDEEIINAVNLNANLKTTDGKYTITRKYAEGFSSPPDIYESKVDDNGKAIYTSGFYYTNNTKTILYNSKFEQITNATTKASLLDMLKGTGGTKTHNSTVYNVLEAIYNYDAVEQKYFYEKTDGTKVFDNDINYLPPASKKGIDTDELEKSWDVYIDRIKPIEQINESIKVGEENKLILQASGENLGFNEFILDGKTVSLDTNLLPITFDFLVNKYQSNYSFFNLSGIFNDSAEFSTDNPHKQINPLVSGEHKVTLKDSVNQTVLTKDGAIIDPNSVSFVFKATQRGPEAYFEMINGSSNSGTESDITLFVSESGYFIDGIRLTQVNNSNIWSDGKTNYVIDEQNQVFFHDREGNGKFEAPEYSFIYYTGHIIYPELEAGLVVTLIEDTWYWYNPVGNWVELETTSTAGRYKGVKNATGGQYSYLRINPDATDGYKYFIDGSANTPNYDPEKDTILSYYVFPEDQVIFNNKYIRPEGSIYQWFDGTQWLDLFKVEGTRYDWRIEAGVSLPRTFYINTQNTSNIFVYGDSYLNVAVGGGNKLTFENATDFISVKSSNSNTVNFVIEDPEDFFQAKVNPSEIYYLTNINKTWTKISAQTSDHDLNTYEKYGSTRKVHSVNVPISQEGIYSFKIQFRGNEEHYIIDGNNFFTGIFTIVIDSTLPQNNVLEFVADDEFYLEETNFNSTSLNSERSLASYAFNGDTNLSFSKLLASQVSEEYNETFAKIYGEGNYADKVAMLDTYKIFLREVRIGETTSSLHLPSLLPGDNDYYNGDLSNPRFIGIEAGYYFEIQYGETLKDALARLNFVKNNQIQVFEIIEVDAAQNYQSYFIYYLPFANELEVTFAYSNYFDEFGKPTNIKEKLITTNHTTNFKSSSNDATINAVLDSDVILTEFKTANLWTKITLENSSKTVLKTLYTTSDMRAVDIFESIFFSENGNYELQSNETYYLTIVDRFNNKEFVITINTTNTDSSSTIVFDKNNEDNYLVITANYSESLYPSSITVEYYTLSSLNKQTKNYDDKLGTSLTAIYKEETNYYLNKYINFSTAVYYFNVVDNFGRGQKLMFSESEAGKLFFEVGGDDLDDKTSEAAAVTTGKQIAFEFNALFYETNYSIKTDINYVAQTSNGFVILMFDYKPFVNSTVEVILQSRLGDYESYFIKQNTDLPVPTFLDRYNETIQLDYTGFEYSLPTLSLINIIFNNTGFEGNPTVDLLYWTASSSKDKAIKIENIFENTNSITYKELGEYILIVYNKFDNRIGAEMTFSFTIDDEESIFYSVKSSSGTTLKASVISAQYNSMNILQYFANDSDFKIYTSESKKIKVIKNGSPISTYVATASDCISSVNDSYFFHLKSDDSSSLDFETYIKVTVVEEAPNPQLKWNGITIPNTTTEITSISDINLTYSTNLGEETNGNYLTAYVYYKTPSKSSLSAVITPSMISASEFESEIDMLFNEAGTYFIEFVDLAGNVVNFQTNSYFTIYNLSSILGSVASENSSNSLLDNIVLDTSATISVDNFDKYSNFEYVLYKDGAEVSKGTSNSLTIKDAGVYELVFNAKVDGENVGNSVYKIFVINPNSARLGLEYTVASNYTISKVYQSIWGSDEKSELNSSNYERNKLVLSQATNGNGFYNVKVDVNNNSIYKQNESFEFNVLIAYSTPVIQSNRTLGEKTTKKITLSFSPEQIYIQQGNCLLKVVERESGEIISEYLVNSKSATSEIQEINIKEVGTYDIQVWSESGESLFYWTSITYQKPLNAVSIILIIIGIVAVLISIVLFIFLRTRMKVR